MKSTRFLIAALLVAGVPVSSARDLTGSRPDIVVVITDDQGMGDLSCMGNEVVRTPHIDAFHELAVRFTDFQVSPTCAPTRAALMSGVAPFKAGVSHTIMSRERLAPSIFTLPQALGRADYRTGIFGKWHLGDEEEYLPHNRGFDEALIHGAGGIGQSGLGDFHANSGEGCYFDNVLVHNDTIVKTKGYCTDLFFEAGLAWIAQQRKADDSYFAYISLNAPHAPMHAPKSYTRRFVELGYDKNTAGRYGMIENIDHNFGRLMEKLEVWGALEETLVIFLTDNGGTHLSGKLNGEKIRHFNFGMHGGKNSPYEGGTHVPCFWYWKGKIGGGADIGALAAHLDIYPTFSALAGAELPGEMQELEGRSLLPLLAPSGDDTGRTQWPDRQLFFHCGRWDTGKREAAIHSKAAVRTDRWRLVNHSMLFDIDADPGETTDVADQYPEVVSELQKAFDSWWESTEPFLVNEGLPRLKSDEHPLELRYRAALDEHGIPSWAPAEIE